MYMYIDTYIYRYLYTCIYIPQLQRRGVVYIRGEQYIQRRGVVYIPQLQHQETGSSSGRGQTSFWRRPAISLPAIDVSLGNIREQYESHFGRAGTQCVKILVSWLQLFLDFFRRWFRSGRIAFWVRSVAVWLVVARICAMVLWNHNRSVGQRLESHSQCRAMHRLARHFIAGIAQYFLDALKLNVTGHIFSET